MNIILNGLISNMDRCRVVFCSNAKIFSWNKGSNQILRTLFFSMKAELSILLEPCFSITISFVAVNITFSLEYNMHTKIT